LPAQGDRDADARYRILFETSRDAIMVLDRRQFIDCNPAALRMFGCTSRRQFLAKHPVIFSPPRQPDGAASSVAARRRIAAAFAEGSQEFEWLHQRLDGTVFPATVLLSRVDLVGAPVLQATVRDVTAYAQAESLLKLQRDLANALTSPGTLTETLNRILAAGCEVEGIDSGGIYMVDHLHHTLDLVCHRGLSPAFIASESHYTDKAIQFRLVLAGRALYLDDAYIANARRRSVRREGIRSIAVVPVKHAGVVVAVLNLASHTANEIVPRSRRIIETLAAQIGPTIARVRAEAAVLASERNFQSLFGTLEDLLFIGDARGRLLHVNPVVERRLGYPAAFLKGKPLSFLHPPALRRRAESVIRDMLAGKTDVCDIPLRARNGTLIPVETRVVCGEWNGKTAIFGTSRDITERQRAERELLARQEQLRNLVSQLSVAEEAERRRIAYGLHDDIGQLLALCKLNLDALAAQVEGTECRDMVTAVGQHVDQLLQVSRALTFDLASPVLQRFGLEAAVEDLCEKMAERHGIPFRLRSQPITARLPNTTEILVFHAVRELFQNVVKHAGARHAFVSLRCAGDALIVKVEDDGVGFGKMRRPEPVGDSFGLHAIDERMRYLGGSVEMASVRPHGASVTLTVPLSVKPAVRKNPMGRAVVCKG
jgi:PAS domain S-box-containing protein